MGVVSPDRRGLIRVLAGTGAVATLAWSAAQAGRRNVSEPEARVFRRVNAAPEWVAGPAWVVMQAGSLGAVFVLAGAKRLFRRPRDATVVLAVGTGIWLAIKLVKPLVGRGRPTECLDRVNVRGAAPGGLGYPSGHAAVATTLALVSTSAPSARAAALSVAGLTGTSRMYVGAHLPLDVAGGFAAGTLTGLATTAISCRSGARSFPAIRERRPRQVRRPGLSR